MANAFRDYCPAGAADPARIRPAALTDLGIGAFVGVVAWPFPIMRLVFQDLLGSAAAGWAVHIPTVLVFMCVTAWAGCTVGALAGGRTVGMYFNDLGFEQRPAPAAAAAFALRWVGAGLAGLFGAAGAGVIASCGIVATSDGRSG